MRAWVQAPRQISRWSRLAYSFHKLVARRKSPEATARRIASMRVEFTGYPFAYIWSAVCMAENMLFK